MSVKSPQMSDEMLVVAPHIIVDLWSPDHWPGCGTPANNQVTCGSCAVAGHQSLLKHFQIILYSHCIIFMFDFGFFRISL